MHCFMVSQKLLLRVPAPINRNNLKFRREDRDHNPKIALAWRDGPPTSVSLLGTLSKA